MKAPYTVNYDEMRLMIIGSDKVFAIENIFVKYLKETDAEICLFPAQSFFFDYHNGGFINKLLFKLGISGIYKSINKKAKRAIEAFRPDVIWVFKGMEIFPETLQWAKKRGIKLANFNPDNPFIFSGRGSGNPNVTNSISLFDLHFTYHTGVKKELEQRFGMPVVYLPFGFDVTDSLYAQCVQQEEIAKVCFLGNPDAQRALFIRQMADAGIRFDVYGNDWDRFITHPNVTVFQPVYSDDFWKTLYRYRVQLNLMRLHNPDSHNMRSFEIPGIAGIMLAPDTNEHRLFFAEGKEAFFYSDLQDAIAKANRLLALTGAEAKQVREAARNRSLVSGYSYRDRALFVYGTLNKLLNG